MENKKIEKKRIFSKLTVGVAALALISCAFVGGTFARYTTGETTDQGGANIADWYIDVENGDDSGSALEMITISPYHIAWGKGTAGDTGPRKNEITDGGVSMRVTNKGQVSADVEITLGDTLGAYAKTIVDGELVTSNDPLKVGSTYTDRAGNTYQWTGDATNGYKPKFTVKGDGVSNEAFANLQAAWEDMSLFGGANAIIVVQDFDIVKVTNAEGGTESTTGQGEAVEGENGNYTATLATGDYIEFKVGTTSWTSDVSGATDGTNGDIRDTWIGENIAMIGYTITWEAVQSSTYQEGEVTGGGNSAP